MDNIGIVSSIVLALGVKVLGFSGMLTGIKGIGTALLWVAKGGPMTLITSAATKLGVAFTAIKTFLVGLAGKLSFGAIFAKIGVAFAAIKTFFVATLFPFLAAAAVPIAIIAGIVVAVVAVLYGLKKSFDDFMFELEATGSVWEAIKTAFVSFFANGLGIILDPIKDGISWVIGKIGSVFGIESFTNASSYLDSFSFVDKIRDGLTFVGDAITGLIDTIKDFVQKMLRAIPTVEIFGKKIGGGGIADAIFGTTEEQEAAKKAEAEEQKQFELNRKALRDKQKLEKEAEEAKKLEKVKAEQEEKKRKKLELEKKILGPKANAFLAEDLKPRPAESGAGANIVNAPTSVVNAPSSSNTSVSTPLRQPNAVISQLASAA